MNSVPPASLPNIPSIRVLGVRVDVVQIPDVVACMQGWIQERTKSRFIAVTGMHGITEAQDDREFKTILNAAGLVVPDGMPLVWLARLRGHPLKRRGYGPELMLTFCEQTAHCGYRHFLYGGVPGVSERLARILVSKFPGIRIAGTYCPPFRPLTTNEENQILEMINGAGDLHHQYLSSLPGENL